MGVVTSAGEYLRLTGKILVFGPTVKILGESGRMPLPFDVVHSGSTTMQEYGLSVINCDNGTSRAPGGGIAIGDVRARHIAWNSDIC
jgi:hypothetical protein